MDAKSKKLADWMAGKTEAEILKYYADDERDFYSSRGNYAADAVELSDTILGAYEAETPSRDNAEAESNLDIIAIAKDAIQAKDAGQKHSKYWETLEALAVTEVNPKTGKHNISALARNLGVSVPTAHGRYHNVMAVIEEVRREAGE